MFRDLCETRGRDSLAIVVEQSQKTVYHKKFMKEQNVSTISKEYFGSPGSKVRLAVRWNLMVA